MLQAPRVFSKSHINQNTHTHTHTHSVTSHLLVKYGLTHGVVPLQRPGPICKTLPVNVICTERKQDQDRRLLVKSWFFVYFLHYKRSVMFFVFLHFLLSGLGSLWMYRMWIPVLIMATWWPFLLLRLIGRDFIRRSRTSCDFSHICCEHSLPPSAQVLLSFFTLRLHI